MNLGQRLRQFRMIAGFTGRALAQQVGLDPSQITKIETGVTNPSLDSLARICNAIGITLSEFFNFDQRPEEILNQLSIIEIFKSIEELDNQSLAELKKYIEYLKVRQKMGSKQGSGYCGLNVENDED